MNHVYFGVFLCPKVSKLCTCFGKPVGFSGMLATGAWNARINVLVCFVCQVLEQDSKTVHVKPCLADSCRDIDVFIWVFPKKGLSKMDGL